MIEVGVVVAPDQSVIAWHEPPGAGAGILPDHRPLWDMIWENRERFAGVAHTHPWYGEAYPSYEDLTTFDAIEKALGRRCSWWVVTFSEVALIELGTAESSDLVIQTWTRTIITELPPWVDELRRRSGFVSHSI